MIGGPRYEDQPDDDPDPDRSVATQDAIEDAGYYDDEDVAGYSRSDLLFGGNWS